MYAKCVMLLLRLMLFVWLLIGVSDAVDVSNDNDTSIIPATSITSITSTNNHINNITHIKHQPHQTHTSTNTSITSIISFTSHTPIA